METIRHIWFEDGRICMRSSEGKVYSRPLEAFPLLKEASVEERNAYSLELRGEAVRWPQLDEDIHISSFYETAELEYDNEVAEIFRRFPQLNVAEVARNMGIHRSLLLKYIYGMSVPSPQRKAQLRQTLHALGEALIAV